MGSSFPSVMNSPNMRSWRRSARAPSGEYLMLVWGNTPYICLLLLWSTVRKTMAVKMPIGIFVVKGIGLVQPIWWQLAHPQAIQDIDEFVSSSDLEKCSITSLAHQWMLCSEWVPSEWESKQLIKTSQWSTPLQSTTCEAKSCVFVKKKSFKMFLTSERVFYP